MSDFFHLLANLDIGKASFLALVALVFWLGRESVAILRRMERHVAETKEVIRRNTSALENLTGVLRRKGIEIRKEELTRGR